MRAVVRRAAIAVALSASLVGGGVVLARRGPVATRGDDPAAGRPPAPPGVRPAGSSLDPAGTTIGTRFPPPDGFLRTPSAAGSYAAYLRARPLRPDGAPVRLFDGRWKARQDVHAAVLALDPGARDLQQCADAAIRLRAEYLFDAGRLDEISFHFTSGFPCGFAAWRTGRRVRVEGARVAWIDGGAADASAEALHTYLETVYTYAGTASLPRDVEPVADWRRPAPGDLYLKPGSPGHAMTVVDVATRGDARAILLAQSYMPAQEIHVVRNPSSAAGDAWYVVGDGADLVTPEWTFPWSALVRFRGAP